MRFVDFQELFTQHSKRVLGQGNLFLLDVDRDELWDTYLNGFPPEYNQIFRQRREFDCACCRSVVKNVGALAAITEDLEVITLWDFDTNDLVYQPMLENMRRLLHAEVDRAFFTKSSKLGAPVTREQLADGFLTWHHLHLEVPTKYVAPDVGAKQEEKRAIAAVFKRSLDEISADAISTALELIDEGVMPRGDEWKGALTKFQQIHRAYHQTPIKKRTKFAWREAELVGVGVAKIRNHSMGTFLTNVSEGMDADTALRKHGEMMDPKNYKHPKAVYTRQMVEKAQAAVAEMGLEASLGRCHIDISRLSFQNVLWANRNARRGKSGLGVFDQLKEDISINPSQLRNIQSVGIEEFMQALPNFQSVEVLFERRLEGNLMSLIGPQDPSAPSLFKWGNPYCLAYNGNLADSMKTQVEKAGGFGNGFFRYSIRWNQGGDNRNDYDAHCKWHNGHVCFQRKRVGGVELDVDIITPRGVAVENITCRTASAVPIGVMRLSVHCYSHSGGTSGFDCEIELDGDLYYFNYPHDIPYKSTVNVADVEWDGKKFTITPLLPTSKTSTSSSEIWGIGTNKFHPVSTIMMSPNFWDGEAGIGNKHFLFMVNGCANDTPVNGFYNEFLHESLTPHRKVFEALGAKMKAEPSDTQLSGLGFSSTQRNSVIVRINNGQLAKIIF